MDYRTIQSREYNTDVLNAQNQSAAGAYGLHDPHPYLRDRQNSDNRTRTSFQDSNVFGYKQDTNVTWQNTGRDDRSAGIRSGVYDHAHKSVDNVVYDPSAPMAATGTLAHQTYVTPSQDMYQHNDPQVPKSRLGAEVFGMADFDRHAARQDLQSSHAHWLSQSKTVNAGAAEAMTHQDRKQQDLSSALSTHQATPAQPGPEEVKSGALDSWKNAKISHTPSNEIRDVNTFERRATELSSANLPLPATDYSSFVPKTKAVETSEEVDRRVKDAFYSDLYGQAGYHGDRSGLGKRSEVNSTTGIFSKEGQSKGNRWDEGMTAAQRRQEFLRTTGFGATETPTPAPQAPVPDQTQIDLARAQLRMPKVIKGSELESASLHTDDFYQKYNVVKDHKEINVFTLLLKNLPRDADAEALKAMAGAKHVVRASVQTDNIKNECTGFGEITIRLLDSETKEDIEGRFKAAGVAVEDKSDDAGQRQSNYHLLASTGWRDNKLESAEKRHAKTTWETHKLSKISNLGTSFSIGDNANIMNLSKQFEDKVRVGDDGLMQAQQTAIDQNNTLLNWNNMRPQTAAPAYGGSTGTQAYMKPTQSYNTRKNLVTSSYTTQYY